ncbi:TIM barrel protein [Ramlibacter sp. 2FC]|uniref:sugar phosphate isomerase/epimerase family protein n=1 Tax=Ramlibacter sp. 2FC TaxID=2502188 RepID=UPI0010F6FE21|nr:TIM barrel protein [Ramlibacter sp. 2FC]
MSASRPEVLVSLSSFGAAEVRRRGQAWFAALAAEAGADGVEVRGELLNEAQAELPAIAALAAERGLSLVYSSPEGLWNGQGALDEGALARGLAAAQVLGAGRLKMAIGGYGRASAPSLPALAQRLAEERVELVIENDQTEAAGTLAALQAFFEQAGAAGLALGMTFDMGNWHWTGEDPLQAAAQCAPRVRYVHCKGVQRQPGQWAAVPLAASAAPWRAILRGLPRQVPRAIEYPLQGDDLLAVTRQQLDLVRSAEACA